MFKLIVVITMAIACASAKPAIISPLAYSAPLVASAPVVTATSSQFIARNYNGYAAAPIAYTSPLGYAAPYLASPYAAVAYSPYYADVEPIVTVNSVAPLKYTAAPVFL